MKIIGFSDVITNSSSEVYTIYDEHGIKAIKALVDAILKAGGSDKTCDDLFDIKLDFDKDNVMDYWMDDHDNENPTREELLDFAKDFDNDNYGESTPLIDGISVTPKDNDNVSAAGLLASIGEIFDHIEIYC